MSAQQAVLDGKPDEKLDAAVREAWKYTPVDAITAQMESAINARPVGAAATITRSTIDRLAGAHGGPRHVFINGWYDDELSSDHGHPDGVSFDHHGDVSDPADAPPNRFVTRNVSAEHDTAVLAIAPDTQVERPIHIVHVAAPEPKATATTISHPRTMIEIGSGATVAIIESYCGLAGATVSNTSTILRIGADAHVDLYRIQTEAATGTHIGHTQIEQAERSRFKLTAISTGGQIARNAVAVSFVGEGATTELVGADVVRSQQRHDTVVTVDHTTSHCHSNQKFTGVASERGKTAFGGEIIVRPATVDTDAHQSSRNLVLSSHAEADARPWLRINADDVRCTHGATVGRLDDDALFYLRSRGIPLAHARAMLIDAFLRDVTEGIPHDSLRDWVTDAIAAHRTDHDEETETP